MYHGKFDSLHLWGLYSFLHYQFYQYITDMKKVIVFFLLSLAAIPMQLSAQVNPQKGYIITNSGDTVHGTIDYLTDARNVKECLFQRNGEGGYKSLSPADIKGYRLADDGIYYVSRLFTGSEKPELLFAEFLIQGGVSLYRYYHDDTNYYGFVDSDGKEVIIRDDRLNSDLGSYNQKLQDRRQKVQDVNALMYQDKTISNRLWKMDLTSNGLTELVKQYDEEYCTSAGDCVVFKYDRKKASAVSRRFYVGAGINYASYTAPNYNVRHSTSFSGNTYDGIAPTFLVGADFLFPRFSRFFSAQLELSFTPHRYEASKVMLEGGSPKMSVNELAARFGACYAFSHNSRIKPYIKGGLHLAWNSGIKEEKAVFKYDYDGEIIQTTGDLIYDNELRCGIYIGAGADIGRIRISALWKKAGSDYNGLDEKGCGILTVAYLFMPRVK